MTATIEEDFELELRSLPGVVNVGIRHRDDGGVEAVVLSIRNHDPEAVKESAVQVASLYYPDAAVILEETSTPLPVPGGGPTAARIVLAAAAFNEHDGTSEVHLSFGARVGIGRAGSGPLIGGAEATLGALRDLGNVIPFYLMGVTKVDTAIGCSVIVALRSLAAGDDRMGIALAEDDQLAAAKATLDALNRYLTLDPERMQAAELEANASAGASDWHDQESELGAAPDEWSDGAAGSADGEFESADGEFESVSGESEQYSGESEQYSGESEQYSYE